MLVTVAFVGSAVYIARKDLAKVFRVLKSPTQNFIKDIKHELDKTAATGVSTPTASLPSSTPTSSVAASGVADASKAVERRPKDLE